MKKLTFLSLTLSSSLLLASCTLKPSGSTTLEDPYAVTKQEKKEIESVAGKSQEEQDDYVEKMSETVSQDSSLDTLEQELDDTVILEEDFSDLE